MLPAYITAIALVVFTVDHSKEAPAILSRNHDTVFEYCLESLPLNFVLMNNLIGFGGCGVVCKFFYFIFNTTKEIYLLN